MSRRSVNLLTFVATLLFIFVQPCLPRAAAVRVVPGSTNSGTFEVRKGTGRAKVESREIEVEIDLPSQQPVRWYVSMLYDPKTKLFWWNSDSVAAASTRRNQGVPALLPRESTVCLTDTKFVLFWNGWVSGDSIFVRESSDHFSSIELGQDHILQVLGSRRGDIVAGKFIQQYREVKFPGLNKDFLYKKYVANAVGPSLKDVTQVDDKWHIVEEGPNGGNALIVLDNNYQVLSVKIEPT